VCRPGYLYVAGDARHVEATRSFGGALPAGQRDVTAEHQYAGGGYAGRREVADPAQIRVESCTEMAEGR